MKKKLLGLFTLAILLSIMLRFVPVGLAESTFKIKGVWLTNVDSDILFNKEFLQKAIDQLAQFNFNTLYPTTWNWGYTLYPSDVAQKATGVSLDPSEQLKERDVLQEILEAGHLKKMRVIPWFEFGFMAPADSQLVKRHKQWLTQQNNGSTIWLEGGVHKRVWLNPLHPDVQEFIRDLIVEIISKYDVDGIQIDDHFGYPAQYGYDPYTVNLYRLEHQGSLPPLDFQDKEWIQWRADKLTDYVETIVKSIKKIKPQVIISLSPNPQEFSLDYYLLDWSKWQRKGLIDEIILQVYRKDPDSFIQELSTPEVIQANQNIPFAIGIMTGVKGSVTPLGMVSQQIEEVKKRSFGGVSFFFYESLWNFGSESKEERRQFWQSVFSQ